MTDDYGRTTFERKIWVKKSQKYWERTINRLQEKMGSLQKELSLLESDFQKAEKILSKINSELRRNANENSN